MKDNIHDFIEAWKIYDSSQPPNDVDWARRLGDAKYYYTSPCKTSMRQWQEIHKWCEQQFGKEHYAWTGNVFWFESANDATLFALRWS